MIVRVKVVVEVIGGFVRKVYYNKLGLRVLFKFEWFVKKGRLLLRFVRLLLKL